MLSPLLRSAFAFACNFTSNSFACFFTSSNCAVNSSFTAFVSFATASLNLDSNAVIAFFTSSAFFASRDTFNASNCSFNSITKILEIH